MNIGFISVAPPYRGGISKHTSILVQKLKIHHSVDVINYSRQYPSFIFPGKTQFVEPSLNDENDRCIDSINPITWLITGNKLAKKKYDLIIIRYWNPFFAPSLGFIANIVKKKSSNTKLVSLCDNILPHERVPMGNFFTKYLLRKLDGHIVQSTQTENELHEIVRSPIYIKRFHPLYSNFSSKIDKKVAKQRLKIGSKHIILYFGIIRDYKGFDILLNGISKLKEKREDFHLLAAGECYGEDSKYKKLIKQLDISSFVTWHNNYIPDDDVHLYFSASDIVALPYRSASQSGIVQIAYNYDLPVIVSNVGGLPEIVDENNSGFIIDSEDPDGLAEVIDNFLKSRNNKEMSKYIMNYKKQFSWKNFVDGIESIYSQLCTLT